MPFRPGWRCATTTRARRCRAPSATTWKPWKPSSGRSTPWSPSGNGAASSSTSSDRTSSRRRSMKAGLIVVVVLIVLAVIFGGMYVSRRNQMAVKREAVNAGWSQVDVVLQRRADLIPNLVETVKGFALHEEQVFGDIAA